MKFHERALAVLAFARFCRHHHWFAEILFVLNPVEIDSQAGVLSGFEVPFFE